MSFLQTLLGRFMTQPEAICEQHAAVLYGQFIDLLTTIICEECRTANKSGGTQQGLIFQIKIMINQRLSESTLSAEHVADAFGISVRYLNMLLSKDGTSFSRYVLNQRRLKAATTLQAPLHAQTAINQIAWHLGFNDMAYFSRAFRAKFGCSPSEYRHQTMTA